MMRHGEPIVARSLLSYPPHVRGLGGTKIGVGRIFDPKFIAVVDEMISEAPLYETSPHLAVFD